jgi:hypothetical protein
MAGISPTPVLAEHRHPWGRVNRLTNMASSVIPFPLGRFDDTSKDVDRVVGIIAGEDARRQNRRVSSAW